MQISTGKNDKGLKLYDPGYLNTAPVRSSISYIDGDEGILRYRGYPIEELAESSTFVEVAYLVSQYPFYLFIYLCLRGSHPCCIIFSVWEFAVSKSVSRLGICYFTTFSSTSGCFGETLSLWLQMLSDYLFFLISFCIINYYSVNK
jgi:hypothetical protein